MSSLGRARRPLGFLAIAILVPALSLVLMRRPEAVSVGAANQARPEAPADDAVAALQRRLEAGRAALAFDPEMGYLPALLEALDVPASSQGLVFAKSSFQLHRISPERPRALYFNDDVYIGSVRGRGPLEIVAMDPDEGPVFYTLEQDAAAPPRFEKQTDLCLACHDSSRTSTPVPRLLVLSVLPDPRGNAIGAMALATTDRSPLGERWGGWYVTGTHGDARHLGNMVVTAPRGTIESIEAYAASADLSGGANLTDLASRIDTAPYPTPYSDLVALSLLAHQTHVHNLMTRAAYEVRQALEKDGRGPRPAETAALIEENGEALIRSMLFSGAAPLAAPIAGTTGFAEEFSRRGPSDSRGRSLRDLDLERRLMRYPLSYLVYSESFAALPEPVLDYVYRRLDEVLGGEDTTEAFAHLSEADRTVIREILEDTKPDFASRFGAKEVR